MSVGHGIDLAGYSTGKTAVARAERRGREIRVRVLPTALTEVRSGADSLPDHAAREADAILSMLAEGPVCVDIPIDLQELPRAREPRFLWQLTMRPIDAALGGLPALASNLGAPTARFQHLLAVITNRLGRDPLGDRLFETYPASSLRQLMNDSPKYKDARVTFVDTGWQDDDGSDLRSVVEAMKMTATRRLTFNDDEVDAAICALTACLLAEGGALAGEALAETVRVELDDQLPAHTAAVPRGYVLLAPTALDLIDRVILERGS